MHRASAAARVIGSLRRQIDPLVCDEIMAELADSKARLDTMMRRSPVAAIDEGWRLVEGRLLALARSQQFEATPAQQRKPMLLARAMNKRGILPGPEFMALKNVRKALNVLIVMGVGSNDAPVLVQLLLRTIALCGMTMN